MRVGPLEVVWRRGTAVPPAPLSETRRRKAERQLMNACTAADQLFHELRQRGVLSEKDQRVCDQIVEAVSEGLRLGF